MWSLRSLPWQMVVAKGFSFGEESRGESVDRVRSGQEKEGDRAGGGEDTRMWGESGRRREKSKGE